MEIRLLTESDVPELTRVMKVNQPEPVFTATEKDVALWFPQAPWIMPGFFNEKELMGALFCERAEGAFIARSGVSRPVYRTEPLIREALNLLKEFASDRGHSILRMELCTQDGMRVAHYLVQAGAKVSGYIPQRHGLEAGIQLEVGLGR